MKKTVFVTLLLSAALMLTACGITEITPDADTSPAVTETPVPAPEESPAPEFEMTVEFAEETVLEGVTVLSAADSDEAVTVLLKVNGRVDDLRLWTLETTEENGEAVIRETRCVDGPVIVTEDSPAAVKLVFEGLLPSAGISFTDPTGMEKHYSVEISGMANEPVLVEFTPGADEYADYDAVIAAYSRAAAEEWDTAKTMEKGLSELFADCVRDDPRATVGYWKTDLDGDGAEELLICANSESVMNSSVLFDVFTTEAGHTLRVCQSSARDRYYWCGDGRILNIYSDSAFQSGRHICCFVNGRLVPTEGVEYDSTAEGQEPWMKLENGSRSPIDEAGATEIEMSYDLLREKLPLTVF